MKWKAQLIVHHNEKRIAVWFEKDMRLIARIKKLADARWSQTLAAWHLPNTVENGLRFKITDAGTLRLGL